MSTSHRRPSGESRCTLNPKGWREHRHLYSSRRRLTRCGSRRVRQRHGGTAWRPARLGPHRHRAARIGDDTKNAARQNGVCRSPRCPFVARCRPARAAADGVPGAGPFPFRLRLPHGRLPSLRSSSRVSSSSRLWVGRARAGWRLPRLSSSRSLRCAAVAARVAIATISRGARSVRSLRSWRSVTIAAITRSSPWSPSSRPLSASISLSYRHDRRNPRRRRIFTAAVVSIRPAVLGVLFFVPGAELVQDAEIMIRKLQIGFGLAPGRPASGRRGQALVLFQKLGAHCRAAGCPGDCARTRIVCCGRSMLLPPRPRPRRRRPDDC